MERGEFQRYIALTQIFCGFFAMAYDTIEIYVRDLREDEALAWLEDVLDAPEKVQASPIVTYEGDYDEELVSVQIAEHVQGGAYTSLWFNAPVIPWDSTEVCARDAHEALNMEVLCYPDQSEEPWVMLRVADGEEEYVDERELQF